VRELLVNLTTLIGRQQCVATQRDNHRPVR
jgi:hypothetical protein